MPPPKYVLGWNNDTIIEMREGLLGSYVFHKKLSPGEIVQLLNRGYDMKTDVEPRILTREQSAQYLGIGTTMFDSEVRPHITEIPFGSCVRFDKVDLDDWLMNHKERNGRRKVDP